MIKNQNLIGDAKFNFHNAIEYPYRVRMIEYKINLSRSYVDTAKFVFAQTPCFNS